MNAEASQDRAKATSLLERWLVGSVTNTAFENQWPWDSSDLAVRDIGRELWHLYDDAPEAPLVAENLTQEDRSLLVRSLAFLRANAPYTPTPIEEVIPVAGPIDRLLLKLFARGRLPWERTRIKPEPARKPWWPFENELQYRRFVGETSEHEGVTH